VRLQLMQRLAVHAFRITALTALLLVRGVDSAVLPDDRADLFYSTYRGGGMDITGESILVRKKFSEQFAVEGNYFIDKVSGASVDVLSQASVIKDTRKQKSLSIEYIHDKTTYNLSYTGSDERDYISNTAHFSLSQDMFGDLTTVTLGFSDSRDKIGENNGTANSPKVSWLGHAQSRSYNFGVSQILTRNLIAGVTYELITDQGLLSNPYRSIRYLDPANAIGYSLGSQIYPNTHTSSAVEGRVKYFLPWHASAGVSYRYFGDTWGIKANTEELVYTHPIGKTWILEGRFRHYNQTHADFYSDLFSFANQFNFEGRDKNLAAQNSNSIGFKATWAFLPEGFWIFKRNTVTLDYTRMMFKYTDFRDIKYFNNTPAGGLFQPGTEPLYSFSANVGQIYFSFFF
jgi:hypothetical protein